MQVRIYKNLHKTRQSNSPTYSVQEKTDRGWRLSRHAETIVLKDVTFKVSEYGRQRCLAMGQKVVHAFVCGEVIDSLPTESVGLCVTYNPKQAPTFYTRGNSEPVHAADYAVVGPHGIIIY